MFLVPLLLICVPRGASGPFMEPFRLGGRRVTFGLSLPQKDRIAFISLSPTFLQRSGYSKEELVGASPVVLLTVFLILSCTISGQLKLHLRQGFPPF